MTAMERDLVDIDDVPALALPPRRHLRCARARCRNLRRPGGGKLCNDCHAAATRRWRALSNAPSASGARTGPSAEPGAVWRRVQLHRAIARGDVERGRCVTSFGHAAAIAHFTVPATEAEPFAGLVWVCRRCRHELVEAARTAADATAAEQQAVEERRRYAARLEASLDAVSGIPAKELERLEELATRGPAGMTLHRKSPWFRQRLAALVEQYLQQSVTSK